VVDVRAPKTTPKKASLSGSVISIDVDEEVETPPKSKGKGSGILGSLKGFKRTQADRSPEEEVAAPKTRRKFGQLVGVVVPPAPLPHSSYVQFGARSPKLPPSIPSDSLSIPDAAPPLSTSPSLSSFESYGSHRNYEAERLQVLLNASQENLELQAKHFDDERRLLLDQIQYLERTARGEGGSGSRRG